MIRYVIFYPCIILYILKDILNDLIYMTVKYLDLGHPNSTFKYYLG